MGRGRDTGRTVLLAVLFEAGLGLLALGLGRLLDVPAAAGWRWGGGAALVGLAASLPMLGVFFACLHLPLGPLRRIRAFADDTVRPLFAPCTLAELALLSAAAGVGEELLFRGLVQDGLAARLGPGQGLALASVLFGLMHPITAAYAVLAATMGAYLGAVYWLTGDLFAAAVTHAAYDFLALAVICRRSNQERATAPAGADPENSGGPVDDPGRSG